MHRRFDKLKVMELYAEQERKGFKTANSHEGFDSDLEGEGAGDERKKKAADYKQAIKGLKIPKKTMELVKRNPPAGIDTKRDEGRIRTHYTYFKEYLIDLDDRFSQN